MLLLRGATEFAFNVGGILSLFQYMLLLRGATRSRSLPGTARLCFNTCSSCEEQLFQSFQPPPEPVSIHAPLARSNRRNAPTIQRSRFQYMLLLRGATKKDITLSLIIQFQYMLLLRGATFTKTGLIACHAFQYMLLLRGATASGTKSDKLPSRFNTCSSCEEQRRPRKT